MRRRPTCKVDTGHSNIPLAAEALQGNALQHFCLFILLKPSQFVKPCTEEAVDANASLEHATSLEG